MSFRIAWNVSGRCGASPGSCLRISPGLTCESTGKFFYVFVIVSNPVHGSSSEFPKLLWSHVVTLVRHGFPFLQKIYIPDKYRDSRECLRFFAIYGHPIDHFLCADTYIALLIPFSNLYVVRLNVQHYCNHAVTLLGFVETKGEAWIFKTYSEI